MEFGKLHDLTNVDFTLPPDPPENRNVLSAQLKTKSQKPKACYIGATGWSMPEWKGKIYPAKTKTADFLHHYTRQFNTIELNTTHYRIPDSAMIEKWYAQSAADFRFCPKVLQRISHAADLGRSNSLTAEFCESLAGLKEKLGPCFIQLPPYFGPERLGVLEDFLKTISLPLAVEVRNERWFDDPQHFNQLFDLLEKYGVSTVITDVAGRRDVCHMRLTTDKVLVRFVGNNLHPTDYARIDEWVERLENWFSQGLSEVYFFTHEPDNLLAPDLAIYLFEKMKKPDGTSVRGPKIIETEQPGEQMTLF
jgi:uncharacterized protein YecE (DUF72 family)